MGRPLQPCGTNGAFQRHLKNGEKPCGPCREANRAYNRADENGRAYQRARSRALTRLAALHHPDFCRLLTEEKAKEQTKETPNA